MISTVLEDIFTTDPSFAIVHQANCFNTLGKGVASGVAFLIGKKYPEAAQADAETKEGDPNKLGTLSTAKGKDGRLIINAYSQFEFGGERPTNYEAVYKCLSEVRKRLHKRNEAAKDQGQRALGLAIPYGYGSMRGGGRWKIIAAMIEVIFENADFEVLICRLPDQPDLP